MHLSAVKKQNPTEKKAHFKHFLLFSHLDILSLHSQPCLQLFLLAQLGLFPELN